LEVTLESALGDVFAQAREQFSDEELASQTLAAATSDGKNGS
jgi:hypothetical protein